MKKFWISLTGVFLVAVFFASAIADPELTPADKNRRKFGSVYKEYDSTVGSNWAVREILAAVSGYKYVIDKIICSISSGGSIYLTEDTDTIFPKIALAESDPFIVTDCNIEFSTGEGVDFYSNINGHIGLWVEYHTE